MPSLREVCDGIARTSTGLARYCVDNDLPVIGAYCAMTLPDDVPLLGTSGAAYHLTNDGVLLDDLSAFERAAPPWFARVAEAYARREVDSRQAATFTPYTLTSCSRQALAGLLPIGSPLLPADFTPTDEQYYLPMYFDVCKAAAAATPHTVYVTDRNDCDNFARAQWGWFAQAKPGNLAVTAVGRTW